MLAVVGTRYNGHFSTAPSKNSDFMFDRKNSAFNENNSLFFSHSHAVSVQLFSKCFLN